MNAPITKDHDCIILDACCIMNLYASGKMEEIISSIAETMAVAVYVMKYETLIVYIESKNVSPNKTENIDLQPLIEKGLLIAVDLETNEEKEAFLEFTAQRLDDGEAATMAIAANRNWAVATDDRSASRIFAVQYGNIQIVSTPEILKHWQENSHPEVNILRETILDIEQRANYLVGSRHPLYEWWQSSKVG